MTTSSAEVTDSNGQGGVVLGVAARLRVERAYAGELRTASNEHASRLKKLAAELSAAGYEYAARVVSEQGRFAARLADIGQRHDRSLAALDPDAPDVAVPGPALCQQTLGSVSNRSGRPPLG
jgi:hypothetical protein